MNYLRKTWVRVILSLFGGGMISELIHISTGDPNRPMTVNLSLLYAVIVYAVLTFIVKQKDKHRL